MTDAIDLPGKTAAITGAGGPRGRVLWTTAGEDFDTVAGTHLRGTFTCAPAPRGWLSDHVARPVRALA